MSTTQIHDPSAAPDSPDARRSGPAISIMMAAYDTELQIAEAIESVLGQSSDDWELIVVDDVSPDRLVARVEPYLADPRVRLMRHEHNGGQGAARNTAAANSAGRYLTVLDSDDRMLPDYVAAVSDYLDERPDIDLVSCDAMVFDENTTAMRSRLYYSGDDRGGVPEVPAGSELRMIIGRNFVYPGATIRRTAFDAVGGYDTDRMVLEDYDLWLRLALNGSRIAILDRPLAVYRMRQASFSRDSAAGDTHRLDPKREYTLDKQMRTLPFGPQARRWAERKMSDVRATRRFREARAAILEDDAARARRLAIEGLRMAPSPKAAILAGAIVLAPSVFRRAQDRHRARLRGRA